MPPASGILPRTIFSKCRFCKQAAAQQGASLDCLDSSYITSCFSVRRFLTKRHTSTSIAMTNVFRDHLYTVMRELPLPRTADPTQDLRMDMVISSGTTNYYVDLTIISPYSLQRRQRYDSAKGSKEPEWFEDAEREKTNKYAEIVKSYGGVFVPFVVSTDGLLSPTALGFLHRLEDSFNRDKTRLVRHPLDLTFHIQDTISTIVFDFNAFISVVHERTINTELTRPTWGRQSGLAARRNLPSSLPHRGSTYQQSRDRHQFPNPLHYGANPSSTLSQQPAVLQAPRLSDHRAGFIPAPPPGHVFPQPMSAHLALSSSISSVASLSRVCPSPSPIPAAPHPAQQRQPSTFVSLPAHNAGG